MSVKDTITHKLETAFAPQRLEVIDESHLHAGHMGAREGGQTHYRVKMAAASLAGKSRVEQHRAINGVLAAELAGGVHALAIEARAAD